MTPVSSLLPLVRRIVNQYRSRVWNAADREDLAQEAAVGLLEAAARYEPGRGASLGWFGACRASGACMDHVRTLARRNREAPAFDSQSGREPWDRNHVESRSPESRVLLARFRRHLANSLSAPCGIEQEVLRLRYQEGLSCRESGVVLGISAATIVRIERRALAELRRSFLESEQASKRGAT
jgi:RNA polymerase sigma factor (sigma-70 family)